MKQSRGVRLKGADDMLFTGEYWAGETSVSLGLADSIGDMRSALRARFGEKVGISVSLRNFRYWVWSSVPRG